MSNMKALVIYYSRSGHTARLAEKVGRTIDADLFRLETSRYGFPLLGYMRAGKDSLSGNLPTLSAQPELDGYQVVALGTPIWTSYPSTPMRAFLATKPILPGNTGLFVTCGDPRPPEKAFAMVSDGLGRDLKATMSLANRAENGPEERDLISQFCTVLTSG